MNYLGHKTNINIEPPWRHAVNVRQVLLVGPYDGRVDLTLIRALLRRPFLWHLDLSARCLFCLFGHRQSNKAALCMKEGE